MKIVKPSFEIIDHSSLLTTIERAGRTCYKSEDKIDEGTAEPFISRIKNFKHESVLEHGSISVLITCDRGVTHELVRHRIASFSQESTRYCSYDKGKFKNTTLMVKPQSEMTEAALAVWEDAVLYAEIAYMKMVKLGASAQQARAVLPNSLKAEIVITANPREWRHIFNLRTHKDTHPDMVATMRPILAEFRSRWPVLFADVGHLPDDDE